MDISTGKIVMADEEEMRTNRFLRSMNVSDMTEKQKRIRAVSLNDHTSKLGKLLTRQRGNMRNRPCPCGSGKKFKKCCWR